VFSYAAPLIWTWVVPLRGAALRPAATRDRGLLATVLLLQYLTPIPSGRQPGKLGTFAARPLGRARLGKIRGWSARNGGGRRSPRRGKPADREGRVGRYRGAPKYSGAWSSVCRARAAAIWRNRCAPLTGFSPSMRRCTVTCLFSEPGMFSFNL